MSDSAKAWEILDDLRQHGWSVAAHNDYRADNGVPMVFWLMVHEIGIYEKAYAPTDADALQKIAATEAARDLREVRQRRRIE